MLHIHYNSVALGSHMNLWRLMLRLMLQLMLRQRWEACYIKHCISVLLKIHKIQSSNWPKWCGALIPSLFLYQTSFQMVRQMGSWYINCEGFHKEQITNNKTNAQQLAWQCWIEQPPFCEKFILLQGHSIIIIKMSKYVHLQKYVRVLHYMKENVN